MKRALGLVALAAVFVAGGGFAPKPGYLMVYNASQVAAMISIGGNPAQAAAPGKPVVQQVRPGAIQIIVSRRSGQKTNTVTLTDANAYKGNPANLTWCASARDSGTTLESASTCNNLMNGG